MQERAGRESLPIILGGDTAFDGTSERRPLPGR